MVPMHCHPTLPLKGEENVRYRILLTLPFTKGDDREHNFICSGNSCYKIIDNTDLQSTLLPSPVGEYGKWKDDIRGLFQRYIRGLCRQL